MARWLLVHPPSPGWRATPSASVTGVTGRGPGGLEPVAHGPLPRHGRRAPAGAL